MIKVRRSGLLVNAWIEVQRRIRERGFLYARGRGLTPSRSVNSV